MKKPAIGVVIGTMFFVIAMLAGLASIAVLYSVKGPTQLAAQSAAGLVAAHNRESLTYQSFSNGTLGVASTGSSGSTVVEVVLKFANGSVYRFTPRKALSGGGQLSVPGLIPSTNSCGRSTCLSKYMSILGSTNSGDSIGLVTSLGNTFWVKTFEKLLFKFRPS